MVNDTKKSKGRKKSSTRKSSASAANGIDEEYNEDVEIVEEEEVSVGGVGGEGYTPKQKPELDEEKAALLAKRRELKKRTPAFHRQEWFRYGRLSDSWRKPRGIHSKSRKNKRFRPSRVRIGFRGPKEVRGLHPSGFEEVMVHNPKELESVDPMTQAARIGHTVGTKKRIAIQDKADELGIRILNRVV